MEYTENIVTLVILLILTARTVFCTIDGDRLKLAEQINKQFDSANEYHSHQTSTYLGKQLKHNPVLGRFKRNAEYFDSVWDFLKSTDPAFRKAFGRPESLKYFPVVATTKSKSDSRNRTSEEIQDDVMGKSATEECNDKVISTDRSDIGENPEVPGLLITELGNTLSHERLKTCTTSHLTCLKVRHSATFTQRGRTRLRGNCLCEEECKLYGNCCYDYPLGEIEEDTERDKQWSCKSINEDEAYYVISSCPKSWANDHVRLQCEDENFNATDRFRHIPVSSRSTMLTYLNVYCAICNKDLNSSFWSTQLNCPDSVSVDARDFDHSVMNKCGSKFAMPMFAFEHHERNRRYTVLPLIKCYPYLVSGCSDDWKKSYESGYVMNIVTKCAMIFAPVSDLTGNDFRRNIKYKNKYCAICNGVERAYQLCPSSSSRSPPFTPSGQTSLSLLLDMDFTQGGTIVGSQERCPPMHLYDPWKKTCRDVMCGAKHIYKDGQCVLNPGKANDDEQPVGLIVGGFNATLPPNCVGVSFIKEEVAILENGTLIIINDGSTLNPGEYEEFGNSTIRVCVPITMKNQYVDTFTNVEGCMTIIGICISLIALFFKILLSLFTKERQKLPSKIVLFLSISLFVSQSLFLFGISKTEYPFLCALFGISLHYFFLATFFWMNVLAYDIWKTFASSMRMTKTRSSSKLLLYYSLYGWLSPMVIVLFAILINWLAPNHSLNPRYGVAVCWISNKMALAVFFGAPLAFLLFANLVFFVITSVEIRRTTVAAKFAMENKNVKDRVQFGLYCKLACIMGLTWVFGFIAAFAGSATLWYFFIIFNSIQGVYVFIAFTHFYVPNWLKPKTFMNFGYSQSSSSRLSVTTSLSKF